jgi:hypothetical protein
LRLFKLKRLAKFARDERISDTSLADAITRAENGLLEADLGGGLIKQRVARQGQGRSGGYRMIIGYRVKNRAIFLFGFAKNERANIDEGELATWRDVATALLSATDDQIDLAIEKGEILEVIYDQNDQ